jgi:hypothetical protein
VTKADGLGAAFVEAAAASRAVRDNAKVLLPKCGAAAVPAICEAVVTGGRELRWWGICVLKDMGPEAAAAVPVLTERIGVENMWFCALIAETLGSMGPAGKGAVPCLRRLLKHEFFDAKMNAAAALARIGAADAETIEAIRAAVALEEKNGEAKKAEAMRVVLNSLVVTSAK